MFTSKGMTIDQELQKDLAQEGWIAMWKALKVHDATQGPLDWWLKYRARGRMLQYFRLKYLRETAVDGSSEEDSSSFWDRVMEPVVEQLEMAYHEGQIREAVDSLTSRQREYVHLRFWKDYRDSELTAHFGYEPGGLWRAGKKRLKEQLNHLQSPTTEPKISEVIDAH